MKPYPFPSEGLRLDELRVRDATDADAPKVAPAFGDPTVGGEAGLPRLTAARRSVPGTSRERCDGSNGSRDAPGTVMRPAATVERAGFQREGRLRSALRHDGRFVDADLCAAVAT